jgi:hypothetical protein
MNLAVIILWLSLRGLCISAAVIAIRIAGWVLRLIVDHIRHERLMTPKNLYFVA